jgi:hypothetical protein
MLGRGKYNKAHTQDTLVDTDLDTTADLPPRRHSLLSWSLSFGEPHAKLFAAVIAHDI